ncbi:MAG: MerR family transcriptional regulator [Magnetovibrio sp.]|nr:MerR family transcriptional regulator [Magnetovibrio sp.]
MDKLYCVEDLAKACDTTPRAVRLYMEKGLLEPMRAGRTYIFTEPSRQRLTVIQRCKRIGLSLNDIKKRLDPTDKAELEAMLERVKDITIDANTELEALCSELSHVRRQERN